MLKESIKLLKLLLLPDGYNMNKKFLLNQRGFSLVELIVVAGLFSLVMAGALSILAVTIKNNYKAEKIMKIRKLGDNAIQVIHRVISPATSLSLIGDNVLSITDTSGINSVIHCNDLGNNTLYITKGGVDSMLIDNSADKPGIIIKQCTFSCLPTTPTSGIIKYCDVKITLATSNEDTEETFTSKTVIRNEIFE